MLLSSWVSFFLLLNSERRAFCVVALSPCAAFRTNALRAHAPHLSLIRRVNLSKGRESFGPHFFICEAGIAQFLPRRAVVGFRQLMYATCLGL